jgi:hypothetical protein
VCDKNAMSVASPAYLEIIDFIAGGTTPEQVVHFRPSIEAQERIAYLIERGPRAGVVAGVGPPRGTGTSHKSAGSPILCWWPVMSAAFVPK